MKIGHLIISLLVLLTPKLQAVELSNNNDTSVELLGWYRPTFINTDEVDEIIDGTSRIGFRITRQLPDDWQAKGHIEWGIALVTNNDAFNVVKGDGNRNEVRGGDSSDSLWTRLGYVEFQHDKYGQILVGKQWGSFFALARFTDLFEIVGGQASGTYNFGTDGGFSGTGRAEQAIQYNQSVGRIDISLQFQATDEQISFSGFAPDVEVNGKFDNSYGASVIFNLDMGLSIGAAYNEASIKLSSSDASFSDVDDQIWGIGGYYGNFLTTGFYGAVVYTESDNHEIDDDGQLFDAKGLEVYLQHRFDNNIAIYGGYNHLEDDDVNYGTRVNQQYELEYLVFGGKYFWREDVILFAEYKLEESTSFDKIDEDDLLGIGVRFDFY